MIINLAETKQFLRIDDIDTDVEIQTLIDAAELYLKNATGKVFDSTNQLAKLYCKVLVVDWFENRDMISKESDKVRFTLQSILMQLQYCE